MFQEKNEGKTHYYGDDCKPPHVEEVKEHTHQFWKDRNPEGCLTCGESEVELAFASHKAEEGKERKFNVHDRLDDSCKCKNHQRPPHPPIEEEWEKEFEAQFVDRPFEPDGDWSWKNSTYPGTIKSFIRSLLQKEYERGRMEEHERWANQTANEHDMKVKSEMLDRLEKHFEQGHGGGNWRRLLIDFIANETPKGI